MDMSNREDLLLWVDDILAHSSSPRELLASLDHIFRCCLDRNIRLSAWKCDLFLKSVTWCGRKISSEGIGFDPEYIQGIQDLDTPKTVGDLQQYICSLNWIRSCIPHYNREIDPFSDCLREIVAKIGSNKKKVLANRKLAQYEEWNEEVVACFHNSKELLKSTIIATHYDPKLRVCVFPDASDDHWGLFITQVPGEDICLSFDKQRHRPLSMMSGTFKGSSKRWHILRRKKLTQL